MLTGCSLYPAGSGSAFVRFSANEYDCLPGILKDRGYSTAAHHAFTGTYWNRDHMYPSMGYDRFFTLDDYAVNQRLGWGLGDRSFLAQTVTQLKSRDRPFYDMAVTLTSHYPYDASALPVDLRVGQLEGTTLGNYLESIHYVDAAVGTMVAALKESGLWDNTVVVLYGDHDNGIDQWAAYEKFLDRPLGPYQRARLVQSVPILMHFPGNAHAGRLHKHIGQIDVMPTLLHALGIPRRGRYFLGQNAFSDRSAQVVFPDGGFADQDVLFVPSRGGMPGDGHCFEHATGRVVRDLSACSLGAEAARTDLAVSELVLENDLLPALRSMASGVSRD